MNSKDQLKALKQIGSSSKDFKTKDLISFLNGFKSYNHTMENNKRLFGEWFTSREDALLKVSN